MTQDFNKTNKVRHNWGEKTKTKIKLLKKKKKKIEKFEWWKTLTQPFPALFRGQPITLSLLGFWTASSLSPFTVTFPLVTAFAQKLSSNNGFFFVFFFFWGGGKASQTPTTNTPFGLWERTRSGKKIIKKLKFMFHLFSFHGSKFKLLDSSTNRKDRQKWGRKLALFFSGTKQQVNLNPKLTSFREKLAVNL